MDPFTLALLTALSGSIFSASLVGLLSPLLPLFLRKLWKIVKVSEQQQDKKLSVEVSLPDGQKKIFEIEISNNEIKGEEKARQLVAAITQALKVDAK